MVTTQSFRLIGKRKPDFKDIICGQIDGENVVFWEDIEQVFPGVKYITNGNTVISLMRDSNRKRITPQCIKYYPGIVLGVVLSTTVNDNPLESSVGAPAVSRTEGLPISPTMTLDLDPEIVQRLVPSLAPGIQARLGPTSNGYDLITQAIKEGRLDPSDVVKRCFQELKTEMTKNTQLSTRTESHTPQSDQLLKQIQAVMARNYELYENPIPRLFVVLPLVHRPSDDPQDSFSIMFRLYFLCDCGEHTMPPNSKTSHHIHFAKHEGYDIVRPNEFFKKYGSYVLTILKMLKFGISVAGITVPALSHLVKTDDGGEAATNLELLVDAMIGHLEKTFTCNGEATVDLAEQLGNNDTVDGVVQRLLGPFLNIRNEGNVLGNLHRVVTTEGHVKWVCTDHYHQMFQEKTTEVIQDTVESLQGSFDENIGRMKVTLSSRDQVDQLHLALEEAKAVYDLNLTLAWKATHSNLRGLRDALVETNVGVLTLNLDYEDGLDNDHAGLFDPIFDIMRHPSIKSFTIVGPPEDFIRQSNLQSRNDDFTNLRYLDVDLLSLALDIPGIKNLVAMAPNLAHLVLACDFEQYFSVYNAIAEYQTYPITFSYQQLCILPPTDDSQSTTDVQDTTEMLRFLGGRVEAVALRGEELMEATLAAFVEATENGSRLKELTLWDADRNLGEQCIKHLATIVARSELRTLEMYLEKEEGRVSILQSVQWEHVRDLMIRMDEESLGMGPLKAVVNGIVKVSGRVELEHFYLSHDEPRRVLSIAQERLLQSLVASTSLKNLFLNLFMTIDQVLSLLSSPHFFRLNHFGLWCQDFKSTEVDAILDTLQHAVELQTITLSKADITEEQIWMMQERGITLSNNEFC